MLDTTQYQDFKRLFQKRLTRSRDKTRLVFRHEPVAFPPVLVNSAFYHLFGTDPDEIPAGIFDDPAVMTAWQERKYYDQITHIDDDFVPYLLPWFGTTVLSSALGAEVFYNDNADPTFDCSRFAIQTARDIRNLRIADPERDGLMPKVLDYIRYMKRNSFLPIGITDCQGPLATANQLMGYDHLFFLMRDDPALAHELMDKVTESLIIWIKRQKAEIGEPLAFCFGDQQIYTGEHAGVWLADDDAVLVGPEIYHEFAVPYNSRVLKAFGGGVLHYCGCANHQIDNFLATEGLVAINNYCLHGLQKAAELQKRIQGKMVLILCDFAPRNYRDYFNELFRLLSPRGLIIDCQFSPVLSLTHDGKYDAERRDRISTCGDILAHIQTLIPTLARHTPR